MYTNKEFFINCNGVNIHSKIDFPANCTDKMPIFVLIPGFTGHIEEDHIIAIAKKACQLGYVVLRSELYGHGKSDGDFYDHNVLLWMSEAMQVVDYAANLEFASEVVLSGHSQGGLTAILAGGIMADKLKSLVLLSPATSIALDVKKGCTLGVSYDPNNLPEYIESPDWKLGSNYIRAARMLPLDETIAAFKKPVLIIHGTEDEAVPYECAENLVTQYADASLVSIPNEDHCYDYHMDQVLDALESFLAR